jgi:Uma2 family endonuclease
MMPASERTFQQLALEDPSGLWELYCGQLRQKPGMTFAHNHAQILLAAQLVQQVDGRRFDVRCPSGHVRRSPENYFIPAVFVFPLELAAEFRERVVLEWYDAPLPLVVEIWSPSTGDYDVETKLIEYQRRGDLEIWLIHPFDRTLIAWRRQPDGSYAEAQYNGGIVQPVALSNVTIVLDALFE